MKLIKEDDPRYKILERGTDALSDAENLSVIIAGRDSLDKSLRLLRTVDYDYKALARMTTYDLQRAGLTYHESARIVAANSFARRKSRYESREIVQIKSSKDVFDFFQPIFADLQHEEFWVLYLNRSNRIISEKKLSQGGISGTVTDVRVIMNQALNVLASGIICAHNHPSGNLSPSESDTRITQKVKEAGNIMDVQLLDHIIVTEKDYYSFADNGLL